MSDLFKALGAGALLGIVTFLITLGGTAGIMLGLCLGR